MVLAVYGERIGRAHSNLNGAAQRDLGELLGDHLVEFKHP